MDVRCMASLLMPVANCAELLVKETVQPLLGRCMEVATTHIRQMDDNTVKSKEMVAISDLLAAIKMLCHRHELFQILNVCPQKALVICGLSIRAISFSWIFN